MKYQSYGLTFDRLKEVLEYDPATGLFVWVEQYHRSKIGRVAGHRSKKYVVVKIDGRHYPAHCLAWLWMTGVWPADEVDHRDLDKWNNRWLNLRAATGVQNKANQGPRAKKIGTLKGVCWVPARQKWIVSFQRKFVGYFDTEVEAHQAYVEKARAAHGEFARAA